MTSHVAHGSPEVRWAAAFPFHTDGPGPVRYSNSTVTTACSAHRIRNGQEARLKIERASDPDKKEIVVTLGKRPDKPAAELPLKKRVSLGIAFALLADGRLSVAQFLDDSVAEQAGLKPGDVITSISGQPAADYVAVLSALAGHKDGDELKIEVDRDGQTLTMTAKAKETTPPNRT